MMVLPKGNRCRRDAPNTACTPATYAGAGKSRTAGTGPVFGAVSELLQISISELFSPQKPVVRADRRKIHM